MNTLYLTPLFGAIIGYLTNRIAIRMLFRPLTAWRVFGLKVPMTPGVIPKKRQALAQNIGEMVGDHLLTTAEVSRALGEEVFQARLLQVLDDRLRKILDLDLGPLPLVVPEEFAPSLRVGCVVLKWRLTKELVNFVRSPAFDGVLRSFMVSLANDLLARPVDAVLALEDREKFYAALERACAAFLQGPVVQEQVRKSVAGWLETAVAHGMTIRDLVPAALACFVREQMENAAPRLLHHGAQLLQEDAVRRKIACFLGKAVEQFVGNLGPIGAFAAAFLNPATVEKKVYEFLQTSKDDIATAMQDGEAEAKVRQLLNLQAERLLDTSLARIVQKLPAEAMDEFLRLAAEQIAAMVRSPATVAAIGHMVRQDIETRLDHGACSLGTALQHISSGVSPDVLADKMTLEAGSLLRSFHAKRTIKQLVSLLVDDVLMKRPLGRAGNLLPERIHGKVLASFQGLFLEIVLREVPGLVDSFQVRAIVARKIDSLDLPRLEQLLLSIMQEQFQAINLFGGLLGFCIGLMNAAMLLLW